MLQQESIYTAFDGTSFDEKIKVLSFSQVEIYAKQKDLSNIFSMFNMMESNTVTQPFHYKYGNNYQNKSTFVQLS